MARDPYYERDDCCWIEVVPRCPKCLTVPADHWAEDGKPTTILRDVTCENPQCGHVFGAVWLMDLSLLAKLARRTGLD